GVNVYGNALWVNNKYLASKPEVVKTFVDITQRAYAACVEEFEPCLKALMNGASGLNADNQRDQWQRILVLMRDETTTKVGLGAFDVERVKQDYDLVKSLIGLDKPFEPADVVTNDMLS